MTTLRLVNSTETEKHNGEVFACTYTPDGAFVVSAGWDGNLRLWEVTSCTHLSSLRAGMKPLSACTITPDGKRWVAGSMEGVVSFWDAHSHLLVGQAVTHTRPVSQVQFSPDGKLLASVSWDRQVSLRCLEQERESRLFTAHTDIVMGCRFTPDGKQLLTWSHDCNVKLWDVERATALATFNEHKDRVTTGDVSPDGTLAATGSRNGELILWDLETRTRLHGLKLQGEVRGCFFLLDGASLLTLDAAGNLELHSVPELQTQVQLATRRPAQCGALSPRGDQMAVGGEDGAVRFVTVEGIENQPLVVTATQSTRVSASRLQKFFGRSSVTNVYAAVCPTCRHPVEYENTLPNDSAPCPHCRRLLRFNRKTLVGAV